MKVYRNGNVGILEYWNHGFWNNGKVDLENQNEYSYSFSPNSGLFSEMKTGNGCLRCIIIK